MTTRKDLIEFAALMGSELQMRPHDISALLRKAATYQRLQEKACERALTAKECQQEGRVEQATKYLLQGYKAKPIFSGDPRGCTLKISVPSGKTNDWGREGICVPA